MLQIKFFFLLLLSFPSFAVSPVFLLSTNLFQFLIVDTMRAVSVLRSTMPLAGRCFRSTIPTVGLGLTRAQVCKNKACSVSYWDRRRGNCMVPFQGCTADVWSVRKRQGRWREPFQPENKRDQRAARVDTLGALQATLGHVAATANPNYC